LAAITAKRVIKRLLPGVFRKAKSASRAVRFRFGHGGSEYRAKQALVKHYGKKVITGPFQEMRYGDNVACSAYVAKLVGSYEEELHAVIEQIIQTPYKAVIDIGCAEGYYAVGIALHMTSATVYAFDTDEDAQRFCTDLARLNRVQERVIVGGLCDHSTLERLAGETTIIICDCEGFESELLDPIRVPSLVASDILVELHEFIQPGLTDMLLRRFEGTHSITLINTTERSPDAYAVLEHVPPSDRLAAVREGRPASMQWAYMLHNKLTV